jgi:hypothetical protein
MGCDKARSLDHSYTLSSWPTCRHSSDSGARADDLKVWASGKTRAEVAKKLEKLAAKFVAFTKGNGLTLNAAKTQLMYSSEAGNSAGGNVFVDGVEIVPSDSIKLQGVRYDRGS